MEGDERIIDCRMGWKYLLSLRKSLCAVMMSTSIFSPWEVITDNAGDDNADEDDIFLVKMSFDAFTPVSVSLIQSSLSLCSLCCALLNFLLMPCMANSLESLHSSPPLSPPPLSLFLSHCVSVCLFYCYIVGTYVRTCVCLL